ncbi:hypothetical protein C8R43DRAFT_1117413 [Mycena crocata]|nr:hypothetical protein C8R43DRAFT_1117413 [Mycena crocata]
MARKAKGTATGRASAFQGEKLLWLLSLETEWRTTESTAFYDKLPKLFFLRYGYDLPVEKNVPGDIEDWKPVDRKLGLNAEQLQVENDFQEEKRVALRKKLANWFRNKFKGRRLHSGALSAILKRMQAMTGPGRRPRRKTQLAWYSSKYYATKMKADFDAVWEGAKEAVPASARISMCQDFVKSRLDLETEEFHKKLAEEAAEAHAEEMKKFKESHVVPERTAEEYHEALQTFDEVGIPLADALSERMGMHIILLAIGPVGDQRGEIRLRSIFSDTTSGHTNRIWGEFDRTAFTEAEKSLTRYGKPFFSPEECRTRAWPPLEVAPAQPAWDGMIPMAPEGGAPVPPETTPAPAAPVPVLPSPAATAPVQPVVDVSTRAAAGAAEAAAQHAVEQPDTSLSADEPAQGATPVTDGALKSRWSQTELDVVELMESKAWGARWVELIAAAIAFEESLLWAKGLLPRSSVRPTEVAAWIKDHRKPGDFTDVKNSWKANFGERFIAWWHDIRPESRNAERPTSVAADQPWPPCGAYQDPNEFSWSDWSKLRQSGGNGMLLVVQAFTWWGQEIYNGGVADGLGGGEAALAENEQWQEMLEDLLFSYGEMTDLLDDETRAELEEERRAAVSGVEMERHEDEQEENDRLDLLGGRDPSRGESEADKRFFAMRERRDNSLNAAAAAKARMEEAMAAMRATTPPASKKKATGKRKRGAEKTQQQEGDVEEPQEGDVEEPPRRKTRSGGSSGPAVVVNRPKARPSYRGAVNAVVPLVTTPAQVPAVEGPQAVPAQGGAANSPSAPDIDMEDVHTPEPPQSEPVPFGRSGLLVQGVDGKLHRAAESEGLKAPPRAAEESSSSSSTAPTLHKPTDVPGEPGEDPFAPEFEDPFADDPFAGLSAEEREDLEREMALDPTANDDDDEDDLEKKKGEDGDDEEEDDEGE